MGAGTAAANQYQDLIGAGPQGAAGEENALQSTPGYQFTLDQGLKAAQNNATAQGLGVSGAAMKAASTYTSGLADQTYQNQTRFRE